MMIEEFNGKKPQIHDGVFIAKSAEIIGDVMIGKESSVWHGSVLRGDEAPITIGECSNVQDNSVIHGRPGTPTIIKDYVTLGHNVIAHSTTINNNCIIGMGAILLNNSEIGKNSIIAAGTVVKERQVIPPNSLAVGIPAKVIKELDSEAVEKIRANAMEYVELRKKYL